MGLGIFLHGFEQFLDGFGIHGGIDSPGKKNILQQEDQDRLARGRRGRRISHTSKLEMNTKKTPCAPT
jgi:hypothetical protein